MTLCDYRPLTGASNEAAIDGRSPTRRPAGHYNTEFAMILLGLRRK
jgi:hypothetical protein